jgi:hypothetical protein
VRLLLRFLNINDSYKRMNKVYSALFCYIISYSKQSGRLEVTCRKFLQQYSTSVLRPSPLSLNMRIVENNRYNSSVHSEGGGA